MAENEILRSRHAFGSEANLGSALEQGKVDAYDILFLSDDGEHKIGWVDKNGNPVIVDTEKIVHVDGDALPESGEEGKIYIFGSDGYFWDGEKFVNLCKPTDLTELEAEMEKKANAEEVDAKIGEIESVLDNVTKASYTHEKVKYEFTDVPVGTLVDYREDEIRVMCPADAEWKKQAVGTGGDANTYYGTFKTYAPSDEAVGYVEHLNGESDSEILTAFSTDEYGRRYQPTWLGLAKYDDATGAWTYYGASSSVKKYIGWDYKIDWYNTDGVMIASDSIRINLSNESCHASIEPYYVTNVTSGIDEKIENATTENKMYTDEQIALLMESMTVVEF